MSSFSHSCERARTARVGRSSGDDHGRPLGASSPLSDAEARVARPTGAEDAPIDTCFDQLVTASDAFNEQDAAASAGPWTIESS